MLVFFIDNWIHSQHQSGSKDRSWCSVCSRRLLWSCSVGAASSQHYICHYDRLFPLFRDYFLRCTCRGFRRRQSGFGFTSDIRISLFLIPRAGSRYCLLDATHATNHIRTTDCKNNLNRTFKIHPAQTVYRTFYPFHHISFTSFNQSNVQSLIVNSIQ